MTIIPENLAITKPKKAHLEHLEKNSLKEKILKELTTDFHDIQIVENKIGRFLKYQETYQAGYINSSTYSGNLPYINYFLIPSLMNQNIKKILFVGLGSGIIINQYHEIFEKLEQIDIVDIEENILDIAKEFFNFKLTQKTNFILQDAIIFLKSTKQKYDLIIVDVAGNEGIDERFCNSEYLKLIKGHLKKDGIFVSNLPSSRDIFNPKNKFILNLLENYKKTFKNIDIYSGETSNKIYYKSFFNLDEIVYDITNLILISSDKTYEISNDYTKLNKIRVDIKNFLSDKVIN